MRGSWYRLVHTVTTLRAAFQFSAGARDFCVLWRVQTGSVTQPATYSMGTGGRGGGGTWGWPLASEQCWGYEWVELYLPSITRLNGVQRGNFTFTMTRPKLNTENRTRRKTLKTYEKKHKTHPTEMTGQETTAHSFKDIEMLIETGIRIRQEAWAVKVGQYHGPLLLPKQPVLYVLHSPPWSPTPQCCGWALVEPRPWDQGSPYAASWLTTRYWFCSIHHAYTLHSSSNQHSAVNRSSGWP